LSFLSSPEAGIFTLMWAFVIDRFYQEPQGRLVIRT
jgi:hypothetical protein